MVVDSSGSMSGSGQDILVLDADENVRKGADRLLREAGLTVTIMADSERAKDQIANRFFPVVLADLDTPTQNAGIELIKFVRERSPQTAVIVMSRRIGFDAVAPVFRAGATASSFSPSSSISTRISCAR